MTGALADSGPALHPVVTGLGLGWRLAGARIDGGAEPAAVGPGAALKDGHVPLPARAFLLAFLGSSFFRVPPSDVWSPLQGIRILPSSHLLSLPAPEVPQMAGASKSPGRSPHFCSTFQDAGREALWGSPAWRSGSDCCRSQRRESQPLQLGWAALATTTRVRGGSALHHTLSSHKKEAGRSTCPFSAKETKVQAS